MADTTDQKLFTKFVVTDQPAFDKFVGTLAKTKFRRVSIRVARNGYVVTDDAVDVHVRGDEYVFESLDSLEAWLRTRLADLQG